MESVRHTKHKKSRRTWTDQQKEELILAASAVSRGSLGPWLKERGVSGSWFRVMRLKYLAAHPELALPAPSSPALPEASPAIPSVRRAAMDFRSADDATKRKLIAEYQALPNFTGAKNEWLKAHNTNMGTFHWEKSKLEKRSPSTALSVRAAGNGQLNRKAPRWPQYGASPLPDVLPSPPAPVPTLNDAILALEVERDHLDATIEKLKRMRDGHR